MPSALTHAQILAEEVLQCDLRQYVLDKRSARPRWSWALIAEKLKEDTDGKVAVSSQAIWHWYAADEAQAS